MIPAIKNPCDGCKIKASDCPDIACFGLREYQAILADRKVVREWLIGKCTEHPVSDSFIKSHSDFIGLIRWNGLAWLYQHRKDCPICMNAFKGE